MLTDFFFLEIGFKLLLFFILVGNLIYLYKKYAVPQIYKEILREQNERTSLLEKERLLASTYHRIENQVQQQKKLFVLLEKNVRTWYQAMNEDIHKKTKNALIQQQALVEKRVMQRKNLAQAVLGKAAVPSAVALARQDLIKKFQTDSGAERFAAMIKELEKGKNSIQGSCDAL